MIKKYFQKRKRFHNEYLEYVTVYLTGAVQSSHKGCIIIIMKLQDLEHVSTI